MPRRPVERGRQRAALLIISALTALLLSEVALRVFGWGEIVVYTPSRDWGYTMTPSQERYVYGHAVHINSLGFRGPEVLPGKSPGRKRIVFLGDSVTYGGARLHEDQLFCRRVAESLRTTGTDVEVLNLSAPGWSPQNWWRYIERNGLYDADLVVVVLPECDLARPFATMATYGHRLDAFPLRLGSVAFKLYMLLPARGSAPLSQAEADRAATLNADAVKRLRQRVEPKSLLIVFLPSTAAAQRKYSPLFEPQRPDVIDLRDVLRDPALFVDGVHL